MLGREINRRGDLPPVVVTAISMGIGAPVLLVGGTVAQGFPALSVTSWLIVAWLAVVNTAFAFTLWNHTLRTLSAFESSIINNTMMIQIPILAWLFLGESITTQQGIGLVLAGTGILVVQVRRLPAASKAPRRGATQRAPTEIRERHLPRRQRSFQR